MNLILGGTGFIGTALAQALTARGEAVTSLSRRGAGALDGVSYQRFDLRHDRLTPDRLARIRHIFILTGQKSDGFDAATEQAAHARLLADLAASNAHVLLASSILVYGESSERADEATPCHPIDAYEAFKLACEAEARAQIPPNRLTIFRIATLYGPRKHDGFVARALTATNADPLVLAGNGLIERDFLFIKDTVGAMLAVRDASDPSGTVNIARGESVTLLMVIATLERVLGRSIPHRHVSEPGSGPAILRTSNERLQDRFGFTTFTALPDGLVQTVAAHAAEQVRVRS